MNPNGKNKISAETEAQVLRRFMAGQTNITALAKEFGLARDTVRRIVKSDFEKYNQLIARAREKAIEREEIRKNEAAKKCMKKKRANRKEVEVSAEEMQIHNYFCTIKNNQDVFGLYSEYEVAKRFGLDVAEVIAVLQKFDDYRELEMYREYVLTKKMEELQQRTAFSMSKHSRINRVQAVMLNLNAYTANKETFVYTYPAARPADIPRRLAVKIPWFDYGHEAKEKARKEEWNSETEQKAMEGDKPVPDLEESNGKKKKKKKHKKKK